MKHLHFLAFALCWLVWGHLLKAQSIDHYSSLDPSQPIEFKGNCLRYADKEIILGPKTFFVDGQLSDREVADLTNYNDQYFVLLTDVPIQASTRQKRGNVNVSFCID